MAIRATRSLAALAAAALLSGCAMSIESPGRGDRLVDAPLYTLGGQRTSLLQVTRGKVAVFKFGASWCHPCAEQIPHMNEVAARYARDNVVVFEIDLRENPGVVRAHAARHDVRYPVLLDPRGTTAVLYSVSSIPVTIVAGPDGVIAYRGGYTTASKMSRVVNWLLKKP